MTRSQAISEINATLATLDDERLQAVANSIADLAADDGNLRELSPRELELLRQSKADFAAGRTYSHEEMVTKLDDRLALLGAPKSTA